MPAGRAARAGRGHGSRSGGCDRLRSSPPPNPGQRGRLLRRSRRTAIGTVPGSTASPPPSTRQTTVPTSTSSATRGGACPPGLSGPDVGPPGRDQAPLRPRQPVPSQSKHPAGLDAGGAFEGGPALTSAPCRLWWRRVQFDDGIAALSPRRPRRSTSRWTPPSGTSRFLVIGARLAQLTSGKCVAEYGSSGWVVRSHIDPQCGAKLFKGLLTKLAGVQRPREKRAPDQFGLALEVTASLTNRFY